MLNIKNLLFYKEYAITEYILHLRHQENTMNNTYREALTCLNNRNATLKERLKDYQEMYSDENTPEEKPTIKKWIEQTKQDIYDIELAIHDLNIIKQIKRSTPLFK